MGTSSTELLCFNRGCGKKFREQDNDDGNEIINLCPLLILKNYTMLKTFR